MRCLLASLLLLASCVSEGKPVRFSTSPAGAQIVLDGRETGFVTPATLDIEDKEVRQVELRLPGYRTAKRVLLLAEHREVVPWKDATVTYLTWRFPLFLAFPTVFIPVRKIRGEQPSRLHVRLERA